VWYVEIVAEAIGFAFLLCIAVLAILAFGAWVHDTIRSRNLKYDLDLYDDVGRWNRKLRRRAKKRSPSLRSRSSALPASSGTSDSCRPAG